MSAQQSAWLTARRDFWGNLRQSAVRDRRLSVSKDDGDVDESRGIACNNSETHSASVENQYTSPAFDDTVTVAVVEDSKPNVTQATTTETATPSTPPTSRVVHKGTEIKPETESGGMTRHSTNGLGWLSVFLQNSSLMSEVSGDAETGSASFSLTLSTIHAAKGTWIAFP